MPTIRLETLIRAPAERCFDLSVNILFVRRLVMTALLETRNRHIQALAELRGSAHAEVGEA